MCLNLYFRHGCYFANVLHNPFFFLIRNWINPIRKHFCCNWDNSITLIKIIQLIVKTSPGKECGGFWGRFGEKGGDHTYRISINDCLILDTISVMLRLILNRK